MQQIPPMLRRRASSAGKMALEVAGRIEPLPSGVPIVFASRHGECARSVELLQELARDTPLSPAAFSLSVHNANAGLWSIARGDRSNSVAIAAGASTVEHALIEACGLLADGAPQVLLVMSDHAPPALYRPYNDCAEQGFAWAWMLRAAKRDDTNRLSLSWTADTASSSSAENPSLASQVPQASQLPGGLDVLRFFLRGDSELLRSANGRRWRWSRHA